MHDTVVALAKHGYLFMFAWITAEQLGAPVPAVPILIAAGVLSATGQITFANALSLGILGCLIGDSAWYVVGKLRGSDVLRVLCRISLNPETCVRRSSEFISRNGGRALLIAKFIPGIGAVAVPMAATSNISLLAFIVYDLAGSLLYVSAYLTAGRLLGDRIDRINFFAGSLGNLALAVAVLGAMLAVGWRLYERWKFRHEISVARILPQEVLRMIENGESPYIVDLRHPLDMLTDARVIPGAIRMTPDELSARQSEIPRDREIILYCT